ncbi:unnamed protein product [Orchesella dallaii]|uniref:C-type lectin domain-containing protein n=1 Tax=Orchesella dallaii TaxID=48710 RepID=A0ABP1RY72_9HEXA
MMKKGFPSSIWIAILILGEIQAAPCIHLVGTVGKKNLFTATRELTWFESLEYCHSLGMSLAVLESEREVTVVEEYLQNCAVKHHVWLAATDLFKEGTFTWMNTGNPVGTLPRWLNGQPDGGLRQNCVLINGSTLKWEDQSCSFIYCRPLCQLLS